MSDTKLTIRNDWGTFEWSLPEYGGPASSLAKACFAEAGVPYHPCDEPTPGDTETCPKCGATSHCTWIPAGTTGTGKPDLRGLGKPVGARGERFTVTGECLLRQCACGYEWLAPVLANGGSPE